MSRLTSCLRLVDLDLMFSEKYVLIILQEGLEFEYLLEDLFSN